MEKEVKKNFLFAIVAQGISLMVSCLTNLILPKVLSVNSFSWWQLFIFYSMYVPCLALGLNDGIYLRYGGAHIESLDFESIKSQYVFGQIAQLLIAIFVGAVFILCSQTINRRLILFFTFLYFIVYTAFNFWGYIFQAVNKTNIYSKSVIVQKLIFLLAQVLLLFFSITNAYLYIIAYICGIAFSFLYLRVKISSWYKGVNINFKIGISEIWCSMKAGISLMIANICSMLILGIGRQIIDIRWGLISFGKISFSLTLMNFALTFIMQIGIVLFPALRRLKFKQLTKQYHEFTKRLFIILPLMYILYIPAGYILKLWLPKYAISIDYLSVILPICYFDSKMELIGNTFFKVLNKQVLLLKVNVITICLSAILGGIGAYLLSNMNYVVLSMVIVIIFRSILADFLLYKYINVNVFLLDLLDLILAMLFIMIMHYCAWIIAFIVLLLFYIVRLFLIRGKY